MYNNTYPDRIQPMWTYFHKLEHNLREYGAFFKSKRSVPKLVTSNENVQIPVLAYVEFNPQVLINWLRSVNCGIALISPSKIDWLLLIHKLQQEK